MMGPVAHRVRVADYFDVQSREQEVVREHSQSCRRARRLAAELIGREEIAGRKMTSLVAAVSCRVQAESG